MSYHSAEMIASILLSQREQDGRILTEGSIEIIAGMPMHYNLMNAEITASKEVSPGISNVYDFDGPMAMMREAIALVAQHYLLEKLYFSGNKTVQKIVDEHHLFPLTATETLQRIRDLSLSVPILSRLGMFKSADTVALTSDKELASIRQALKSVDINGITNLEQASKVIEMVWPGQAAIAELSGSGNKK